MLHEAGRTTWIVRARRQESAKAWAHTGTTRRSMGTIIAIARLFGRRRRAVHGGAPQAPGRRRRRDRRGTSLLACRAVRGAARAGASRRRARFGEPVPPSRETEVATATSTAYRSTSARHIKGIGPEFARPASSSASASRRSRSSTTYRASARSRASARPPAEVDPRGTGEAGPHRRWMVELKGKRFSYRGR